jgi:hypothetical protein
MNLGMNLLVEVGHFSSPPPWIESGRVMQGWKTKKPPPDHSWGKIIRGEISTSIPVE